MAENVPNSLAGKRIVITRVAAQSDALAKELSARGAIPTVLPLISFAEPEDSEPLDRAIAGIADFDWLILTSAQAVRALVERSVDLQKPLARTGRPSVACVGPVTAEAARSANLPIAYVATTHTGVALANELGSKIQGARVLLPRSDRANPDLPEALKCYGALVTEVVAYRTLRSAGANAEELKNLVNGHADAVLFFSPSAVQHFAEVVGAEQLRLVQDKLAITAVGPVTAKALRDAGVARPLIAAETSAASVIETLETYFAAANVTPAGVRRA